MRNKTEKQSALPATLLKPGEFPLGSSKSRAAARMLAEQRDREIRGMTIILRASLVTTPRIGKWFTTPGVDGGHARIVNLPGNCTWPECDHPCQGCVQREDAAKPS